MAEKPAGSSTRRRVIRGSLLLASLIALYALAGFFLAPPLLRTLLVKQVGLILQRQVSLRQVKVNPFTVSATLLGLDIRDAGQERLLGCDRLFVDLRVFPWLRGEYGFDAIEVEGLSGRLVMQKSGTLNVSDIIERLSAPAAGSPAPATPPAPAAPPLVRIGRLRIEGASLEWTDRTRSPAFTSRLGPVRLRLDHLITQRDEKNPYAFSGSTESGETFAWKGSFSLDPIRSEGELSLGNIALPKYAPYYAGTLPFDLLKGTADAKASYRMEWAAGHPMAEIHRGSLVVRDLAIAERGSATPDIEVSRIEASDARVDLLGRKAEIPRVALTGGRVTARIEADGQINVERLLGPPAASTTGASAASSTGASAASNTGASAPVATPTTGGTAPSGGTEPAAPPIDAKVGILTIDQFKGRLEDLQTPRPIGVDIEKFSAVLKNASTRAESAPDTEISLSLAGGGTIQAKGKIFLRLLKGNADVQLRELPLAPFDPFLADTYAMRLTSGLATGDGKAEFDFGNAAQAIFLYRGDLEIDHLSAADEKAGEEFLRWSALRVRGVDFNAAPQTLTVREIVLENPAIRCIVRPDGRMNLADVLKIPPAGPEARPDEEGEGEAAPAAPAPSAPSASPTPSERAHEAPALERPIRIGSMRVTGGSLAFLDHSIDPPVALTVKSVAGSLGAFSSDSVARGDIDISALVDGVAPSRIAGHVNPLVVGENSDLTVEGHGIDLAPLGPYFGKYLGYRLTQGKVDLDMHYKVESRKLASENKVVATRFTLGEKTGSPDATKLPVKLGLALLRDPDGKIVLDVPVEGSLDDPEFRLKRVILRSMVNVFRKIVASPFKLLGKLFSREEVDLSTIEFPAGSAEPDPSAAEKMTALAKSLRERPELRLEVGGDVAPAADGEAIRRQTLERLLREAKWKAAGGASGGAPEPLPVAPEERPRWVEALFRERFPAAIPPPSPPPDAKRRSAQATDAPAQPAAPSLAEMEEKLLAGIEVSPGDLNLLAQERARRVRDGILSQGEIDAARVFLVTAENQAPAGKGSLAALAVR
jgi:uncharacterized protein involved in outer membrane biogenesis